MVEVKIFEVEEIHTLLSNGFKYKGLWKVNKSVKLNNLSKIQLNCVKSESVKVN
jgi:hypothetical protein